MKRFVVIVVALAACSGKDKAVERPVVESPVPVSTVPTTSPAPAAPQHVGPPVAGVKHVRDTYHGVVVEDPYRWLEGSDAEVTSWVSGQNAFARKLLEGLPDLDALRTEVGAILNAPITHYGGLVVANNRVFATRKQPNKEQADLIVFDDPTKVAEAKLVLDPTAGGNTHRTIDWYVPSPDGKLVAVSISEKGSEEGTLHVIDLAGQTLETIRNVQRGTGGGSVAWTPDGKGFYYTRYPASGEKPDAERDFWMQVWFHTLNGKEDRYELGKDFPKIAEILLESDKRGRVLAKVQNGDGGEFRHYLRDTKGWRMLDDWKAGIVQVNFGTNDELWAISLADAPRGKVLRAPVTATSFAKATVVVPQSADALAHDFYDDFGVIDGGDRIYLAYQTGGPEELRAFTRAGKAAKAPALPPVSASAKPVVWKSGVLVASSSYTVPRTWYRFDAKTNTTTTIEAMSPKPPVDMSGVEVIREMATSKDGTKVPLTILWPKGAQKTGATPCLASGYGGYNSSETPGFLAAFAPLLSRGVCVVRTNIRGGGEFGEEWHRAGMLTKKQNVFDDFAATLQFLVDNKYTRTDKLAIMGGSNGGLLMGAIIAQHPTMVKAVVALVGIYDMVRAEQSANGEYNITEFGTVKDKAQFEAMHAYSPYHHVAKATYPAIMMSTGENDPRVPSWHSRKFAAALQAAQQGPAPIILRTSTTAGHGMGTAMSERIEDLAQTFAFVLWQLR